MSEDTEPVPVQGAWLIPHRRFVLCEYPLILEALGTKEVKQLDERTWDEFKKLFNAQRYLGLRAAAETLQEYQKAIDAEIQQAESLDEADLRKLRLTCALIRHRYALLRNVTLCAASTGRVPAWEDLTDEDRDSIRDGRRVKEYLEVAIRLLDKRTYKEPTALWRAIAANSTVKPTGDAVKPYSVRKAFTRTTSPLYETGDTLEQHIEKLRAAYQVIQGLSVDT